MGIHLGDWTLAKILQRRSQCMSRLLSRVELLVLNPTGPTGARSMLSSIVHPSPSLCRFIEQVELRLLVSQRRHLTNMADACFWCARR